MPAIPGPFETLTRQLQEEITVIGIKNHDSQSSEFLLWILVLGAVAAIGLSTRRWFLMQIRALSAQMGLQRWHEVTEILQLFLWLPSINDLDGKELLIEIQNESFA